MCTLVQSIGFVFTCIVNWFCVHFDFLLQKSLAGTLPATLAPFADRFTRQTADLANARMTPFCAVAGKVVGNVPSLYIPGRSR